MRDLDFLEEQPDVYICGPPALVDATVEALSAAGVPPKQIYTERITAN